MNYEAVGATDWGRSEYEKEQREHWNRIKRDTEATVTPDTWEARGLLAAIASIKDPELKKVREEMEPLLEAEKNGTIDQEGITRLALLRIQYQARDSEVKNKVLLPRTRTGAVPKIIYVKPKKTLEQTLPPDTGTVVPDGSNGYVSVPAEPVRTGMASVPAWVYGAGAGLLAFVLMR